jgi:hypothetical protein
MLAAVGNYQFTALVASVPVPVTGPVTACANATDVTELKHKQIPRRNRNDLAALHIGLFLPPSRWSKMKSQSAISLNLKD